MNKYILDKRKSIIKLNTDTLDLKSIDTVYDIDYVWIIDEDGILIRSGKEYKVEKGDVVLLMYRIGNEKEGDLIIINNNDLNNYFERKKKFFSIRIHYIHRIFKMYLNVISITIPIYCFRNLQLLKRSIKRYIAYIVDVLLNTV